MSHKCKGLITYDDTRKTEGYEREFVFVNLVLSGKDFQDVVNQFGERLKLMAHGLMTEKNFSKMKHEIVEILDNI